MENPVPFVLTGEDGTGLVIDPQAKAALSKIDKPLVVVSVVGMYRTGKSFLLNRLMNRTDGFPLGSTIEAKTKGIWMWVGDFPSDPSKALVLLDTEGLHDPEKSSKTHDARIFTLSVLLSSILVYNTKGAIDASSLEGLQLATELTSHISMKAGDEEEMGEDFAKFFPVLVWAVRDHHLKLSVDGKEISSNDYLENCLTMKKARKKEDHDTNFLRETIRDFFKERQCFVFPLPTSMDKLENLEQMQLSELDPEFVTAGNKFAEFVIQRSPSKMVRGKAITGMMYATLAEQYVEAIVAGNVNIESAYESMIFMENSKSKAAALEFYKAEMNGLQLPLEMDALNAANAKAHETATGIFLKTAVNSHRNNNYFEEMTAELSAIFEDVTEKNLTVSNEVSYKILEDMYAPIDSRVGAGEFTRAGGHQAYKKEVEKMAEDYKKLPNNQMGPCGYEALAFFQREKIDPRLGSLLQADKALSEKEKKAEQLRREVEVGKEAKALLEKKAEEHQEEMKKTFDANLKRHLGAIKQQHQQDIETLQDNMRRENEEKERLITEGLNKQADMMREQIQENKKEMAEKEEGFQKQLADLKLSFQEKMRKERTSDWCLIEAENGCILSQDKDSDRGVVLSHRIPNNCSLWRFDEQGLLHCRVGSVLDIPRSKREAGVQLIGCSHKHGGDNQRFSYDGSSIWSELNGFVLDVKGGPLKPGTPVIMHPYHGGSNQKFKFVPVMDQLIRFYRVCNAFISTACPMLLATFIFYYWQDPWDLPFLSHATCH